jgi:hypothetical protein
MSGTDRAIVAMVRRIAQATGRPEGDLLREFNTDMEDFVERYGKHLTPDEREMFGLGKI